jgi:hypothetical protein
VSPTVPPAHQGGQIAPDIGGQSPEAGSADVAEVPAATHRPLTPSEFEEVVNAILEGYPARFDLVQRLWFKWGIRAERVVRSDVPDGQFVDQLVQWANAEGRGLDLLGLLWANRPGNSFLTAIGARLLGSVEPFLARYDSPPALEPTPAPPVTRDNLERLITRQSRLNDYVQFSSGLEQIGRAVCRIEVLLPEGLAKGTGFLIDEQTVLTNFHVIDGAQELDGRQVTCRFDFWSGEEGVPVSAMPGRAWLLSSSPASPTDRTGIGQPAENELDYAVIRLAEPVAANRLPLALPKEPSIVAPMDIAIIVQHPQGDPLKIAMGVIVELPSKGMRYRYNTTTDLGASGSPVFSASLDLIGLHHAADPDLQPRYNQAVPLWRVTAALAQAEV